jgi:TM2 domain-containing membrane protein YozV
MSEEKTKYCHNCGAMIPYYDRYCPACNAPQPVLPGMEPVKQAGVKKVWIAVLLSFLITGAGQLYLGESRRGATFLLGTLLIGVALSYYFTQDQIMGFGVAMALISAYDAYRLGLRKQGR